MSKIDTLLLRQQQLLEAIKETNTKLEKLCAVVLSNVILQEGVDPTGRVRGAEECGIVVSDAFAAALCLSAEFSRDQKAFDYSLREFYVEEDAPMVTEEPLIDDDDDSPAAGISPVF